MFFFFRGLYPFNPCTDLLDDILSPMSCRSSIIAPKHSKRHIEATFKALSLCFVGAFTT